MEVITIALVVQYSTWYFICIFITYVGIFMFLVHVNTPKMKFAAVKSSLSFVGYLTILLRAVDAEVF